MTEPYRDPNLPRAERVRDLIARMTLDEKIDQISNQAGEISRLGIPAYNFWSEALHGVARNGNATVFPQAIGMASSWDPELIERVAGVIGDEGRAKYHTVLRQHGSTKIYQGITFWSPNINIFRDPRWGRGQETWGEDPFLTGEMGAAFVRGLQGDHPEYLKAAACAKHYAVHSGPEDRRHSFNVDVSPHDLADTYLPAFRKLVTEAKVEAVMGAYNRVNGEPCNGSRLLLEDTLRGEWNFAGHVVSDCGALDDFHIGHRLTANPIESAVLALKSGCDLACGTYKHLKDAVEQGLVSEAQIDKALERVLTTRFKLGMFDPDERVPYAQIPMSAIDSPAHRETAYQVAQKGMVLLKNNQNILPIKEDVRTVCVIGPNAASIDALLGNYYGVNRHMVTLMEGIVDAAPDGARVDYYPGVQLTTPNLSKADWSPHAAASSDVTIACMGLSRLIEGEEGDTLLSTLSGDRAELGLPAVQVDLLRLMHNAGAKIVLVLASGSPITLGEVEEWVEAIVWVGYPGEEGGHALGDLLFGKASPSGRLPITWPKSLDQLPPFEDYDMSDRTYRYASWEALFPFGFGLGYSKVGYANLALSQPALPAGIPLEFAVTVKNEGPMAVEEVVQAYVSRQARMGYEPKTGLVAFRRVALQPGESRMVDFSLSPEQLLVVDAEGRAQRIPGAYHLHVGGCSPSPRCQELGAAPVATATFELI